MAAVDLDAALTADSSTSATLGVAFASTVAITADSSLSANLNYLLASAIVGSATVSANTSVARPLTATISGTAVFSPPVILTPVTGALVGSSTVSAALSLNIGLSSSINGIGLVGAALIDHHPIGAIILATSTTLGNLTIDKFGSATTGGNCAITGNAKVRRAVASAIQGTSAVTSALTQFFKRHAVGAIGGQSATTCAARISTSHRPFVTKDSAVVFHTAVGIRTELPPKANPPSTFTIQPVRR